MRKILTGLLLINLKTICLYFDSLTDSDFKFEI